MAVFDAAEKYRSESRSLIILAGKDYGSGSSRDWAAKGPWILVRQYSNWKIVLSLLSTCVNFEQLCNLFKVWENTEKIWVSKTLTQMFNSSTFAGHSSCDC